jgi:hypothetical protein
MTKTKKYYDVQIPVDSWVRLIVERDKEMSKEELIDSILDDISEDNFDNFFNSGGSSDQFEVWEPDYKDIKSGLDGQNHNNPEIYVRELDGFKDGWRFS